MLFTLNCMDAWNFTTPIYAKRPKYVETSTVSVSPLLSSLSFSEAAMESIVLYPSPLMGHLISMVELGKLILNHYPSFTITILITTPPFKTGSPAPYISHVSSTNPSINFYHLPTISLLPDSYPTFEALIFDFLHLNNPNVHHALQSISHTSTILAFIIDGFCTPSFPVSAELNIPTYYFFTSGASCLASFLYLSTIHRNTNKSLKDLNAILHIPGLPPIPSSDMVEPTLDRTTKDYECFLEMSTQMPKSAGIIVNTFESLEPKAVKAISDGLCVPDGPTAPIFCIGPLIAANDRTDGGRDGVPECLTWLDSQPSRSVVFLCFGSLGTFPADQLKEIALGLERSEQRFLWVVRSPRSEEHDKSSSAPPDPDLDLLLPEGFLDRTKERGFVIKKWAPQAAVLNHDSVGGFVTHCGWNSVLEAVCGGVPMIAWPLYAEQRLNRIILVEEMKVALSMNELQDGFVSAAEVDKRVRGLMEREEGNLVRQRAMATRDEVMVALSEAGSARIALTKLVESWKQG